MEEYAAFNAAPGSEAQFDDEISPAKQGINPFAQPFTPAHLVVEQTEDDLSLHQPETLTANFQELQLQEDLVEEQFVGIPSVPSKYFDLCDKVANNTTEEVEDPKEGVQSNAVISKTIKVGIKHAYSRDSWLPHF